MSETYLMSLTVPQRLLILVMTRMAHNDKEDFLTEQLLPRSRKDLRPRDFSMSARNIIATDQVFYQTATDFPTVAPMVKSAVDRAVAYGKRHPEIGDVIADQVALPDPTPDFEVGLVMSYRQRKRLAFFCFYHIFRSLQVLDLADLGRLVPGIILLDKLIPQNHHFKRQTLLFDDIDLATLAPIVLGVSENYSGYTGILTQMLDGVQSKNAELWGLLNELVNSTHGDLN